MCVPLTVPHSTWIIAAHMLVHDYGSMWLCSTCACSLVHASHGMCVHSPATHACVAHLWPQSMVLQHIHAQCCGMHSCACGSAHACRGVGRALGLPPNALTMGVLHGLFSPCDEQ